MAAVQSSKQPPTTKKNLPTWTKFAIAGLGGATGWLVIHPADVCKVRMQINTISLNPPGMATTFLNIIKTESPFALYNGLSAGLTRQLTYTTLRLGLYDVFRELALGEKERISIPEKLIIGLTAGGTAATVCNPVEVSLVRMQADGAQKNPALKRHYKHVFDAFYRVVKEEGFFTLYRGVKPTVIRGMVVSCVQLASYDQAKETLRNTLDMDNGPKLHLSAAVIAGFLYSVASLPLDICKTRMQNQYEILYTSIPQTLVKIVRDEGTFSLWKGFAPYFTRSGGHTITMFLCVEQYRKFFRWMYEEDNNMYNV